jgi:hypothetical protein
MRFAALGETGWEFSDVAPHLPGSCSLGFDPADGRAEIAFAANASAKCEHSLIVAKRMGDEWELEMLGTRNAGDVSMAYGGPAQGRHIAYQVPPTEEIPGSVRLNGREGRDEHVDGEPNSVGSGCSLAFDAAGEPHITCFDATAGRVEHAFLMPHKFVWGCQYVDTEPSLEKTSLAASAGRMCVTYTADPATRLVLSNRVEEEVWSPLTVVRSGEGVTFGPYSSLVLDGSERAAIAFCAEGTLWFIREREEGAE